MTRMEHSQEDEVAEIGHDLDKWLKAMEGLSILKIDDMCLVLDLVIPSKFKYPTLKSTQGIASQGTIWWCSIE